jgi:hypothetical protein
VGGGPVTHTKCRGMLYLLGLHLSLSKSYRSQAISWSKGPSREQMQHCKRCSASLTLDVVSPSIPLYLQTLGLRSGPFEWWIARKMTTSKAGTALTERGSTGG